MEGATGALNNISGATGAAGATGAMGNMGGATGATGVTGATSTPTQGTSALDLNGSAAEAGQGGIATPGGNQPVDKSSTNKVGMIGQAINAAADSPMMDDAKNSLDSAINGDNYRKQLEQGGPKEGDKAGLGKEYNENGEIEDTSTKKVAKAAGRAVAAYFTKGESVGVDNEILNSEPVDNVIGGAADVLDKTPLTKMVSEEVDDAGIPDLVNGVLDTYGSAKNKDVAGTIENAKKTKEAGKKATKHAVKRTLQVTLIASLPLLLTLVIFIIILAPALGGIMDIVESVEGVVEDIGDFFEGVGEFIFGEKEIKDAQQIIVEIPDYGELSDSRQLVLTAAAQAVAAQIPYGWGSHAVAPGLEGIPTTGLDCSAFVEWALWTGTGTRPGYLTTGSISQRIGKDFIQISKDELRPGDIGLKRLGGSTEDDTNHTGIYAGNNQWIHATGGNTKKVVRNNYRGFTIYLRYVGLD